MLEAQAPIAGITFKESSLYYDYDGTVVRAGYAPFCKGLVPSDSIKDPGWYLYFLAQIWNHDEETMMNIFVKAGSIAYKERDSGRVRWSWYPCSSFEAGKTCGCGCGIEWSPNIIPPSGLPIAHDKTNSKGFYFTHDGFNHLLKDDGDGADISKALTSPMCAGSAFSHDGQSELNANSAFEVLATTLFKSGFPSSQLGDPTDWGKLAGAKIHVDQVPCPKSWLKIEGMKKDMQVLGVTKFFDYHPENVAKLLEQANANSSGDEIPASQAPSGNENSELSDIVVKMANDKGGKIGISLVLMEIVNDNTNLIPTLQDTKFQNESSLWSFVNDEFVLKS